MLIKLSTFLEISQKHQKSVSWFWENSELQANVHNEQNPHLIVPRKFSQLQKSTRQFCTITRKLSQLLTTIKLSYKKTIFTNIKRKLFQYYNKILTILRKFSKTLIVGRQLSQFFLICNKKNLNIVYAHNYKETISTLQ